MREIRILYSDDDMVVCVKPAGVSSEEEMPALLHGALCVHRLDTAVGGVMVYAKNKSSAAALSRVIAERKMEKTYLAVCSGAPEEKTGVMRDYLFKDSRSNKVFPVKTLRKGAKEAELAYEVLAEKDGTALVKITLHTGRSHQIRVQFASRKMPLLGDGKYGSRVKGNIALWSYALRFAHPVSGEEMRFVCPPDWEYFPEVDHAEF